jgi:hypothetical protein
MTSRPEPGSVRGARLVRPRGANPQEATASPAAAPAGNPANSQPVDSAVPSRRPASMPEELPVCGVDDRSQLRLERAYKRAARRSAQRRP